MLTPQSPVASSSADPAFHTPARTRPTALVIPSTGKPHHAMPTTHLHSTLQRLCGPESIPIESEFWTTDLPDAHAHLAKLDSFEMEKLLQQSARQMAANNCKSQNLCNLLRVLTLTLEGMPRDMRPIPPVLLQLTFLSRVFLKHNVETMSVEQLRNELDCTLEWSPPHSPTRSQPPPDDYQQLEKHLSMLGQQISEPKFAQHNPVIVAQPSSLAKRLVEALLAVSVEVDVTADTYTLHCELITTLLVLMATQMYAPAESFHDHLFLSYALSPNHPSLRIPEVVQALLFNFIEREPTKTEVVAPTVGLVKKLTKSFQQLLLLPYRLYSFFFPASPLDHSLSDRSLMVLLLLVYQPVMSRSNNAHVDIENNVYLQALTILRDDENLFQSDKHNPMHSISFTHLYLALASSIHEESSLLLFYTLLHRNKSFREFVFAKSDVDGLMVPLLESLYQQRELRCNRVYMILIVLLILSQDPAFSENIHARLRLAHVPWFKERVVKNISVGSLMLMMLLKVMQQNLTQVRDVYLHSNCLATLANMSPHITHLHPLCAERLLSLLRLLHKKIVKLNRQLNESESDATDNIQQEMDMLCELARVLLEMLFLCISPHGVKVLSSLPAVASSASLAPVLSADRHNLHLIYCMLQQPDAWQPLGTFAAFVDIINVLKQSCTYFDAALQRANLRDPSIISVMQVLSAAALQWPGVPLAHTIAISDTKFTYEEQPHAEDFFLPYLWSIVHDASKLVWSKQDIRIFSITDHQELNANINAPTSSSVNVSVGVDELAPPRLLDPTVLEQV